MNVEGMQTRYIYCNNDNMAWCYWQPRSANCPLAAPSHSAAPACLRAWRARSWGETMWPPPTSSGVGQSTNTWTRTRPRPDGQQLWILGGARLLEAGGQVSQPTWWRQMSEARCGTGDEVSESRYGLNAFFHPTKPARQSWNWDTGTEPRVRVLGSTSSWYFG